MRAKNIQIRANYDFCLLTYAEDPFYTDSP